MNLALSSEAAPNAPLAELLTGATRRGLGALHLVDGHAHGIALARAVDRNVDALLRMHDMRIAAFELRNVIGVEPLAAAELSRRLSCVIIRPDASPQWIAAVAAHGGRAIARFELNAAVANVAEAAMQMQTLPAHFILRGGGPEAARYEGRGIGALMARLSVAGYRGTIALAPTGRSVLPVWNAWLNHGRGWGCGSKTADPSLVQLG